MIRSLILFFLFTLTSCSSYKWVDLNDCKEKVENLGKCRLIKE